MPKTEFLVKLCFLFLLPGPDCRISTLTALTDVHSIISAAEQPSPQGFSSAQTWGTCYYRGLGPAKTPQGSTGLAGAGAAARNEISSGDAPGQDANRVWAPGAPS